MPIKRVTSKNKLNKRKIISDNDDETQSLSCSDDESITIYTTESGSGSNLDSDNEYDSNDSFIATEDEDDDDEDEDEDEDDETVSEKSTSTEITDTSSSKSETSPSERGYRYRTRSNSQIKSKKSTKNMKSTKSTTLEKNKKTNKTSDNEDDKKPLTTDHNKKIRDIKKKPTEKELELLKNIIIIGNKTLPSDDDEDDSDYSSDNSRHTEVLSDSSLDNEKDTRSSKVIEEQIMQFKKQNKGFETKNYYKKHMRLFVKEQESIEKKLTLKKEEKSKKYTGMFSYELTKQEPVDVIKYFKKLSMTEQRKIIRKMQTLNKYTVVDKPYHIKLLDLDISIKHKAIVLAKINSLYSIDDPSSGEYHKLVHWVDNFFKIPFDNYIKLPVHLPNSFPLEPEIPNTSNMSQFMNEAIDILNDCVYGLNDAKMQIIQLLGQLVTNPASLGTAVAIHGPMGTGKTSLIKDGVSKILRRPFAFIALGGATDGSMLNGFSYTYEGSKWGKIVQILMDSKCMNPVIYFDELDKVSASTQGDEINGILTHLTDVSQNTDFHDKFYSELNFDVSKCMFIFSYNDGSKINSILKDRMFTISTKGYSPADKLIIANKYIIPKICKEVAIDMKNVTILDEVLTYIIQNTPEQGVRNFKRILENIYTKINLYKLLNTETTLFGGEKTVKVEFPLELSMSNISKFWSRNTSIETYMHMYV